MPEDLFTEALRADLIRWPWLRARLELAYGRWLRRQRRVTQARLPLRSAQITFELIGARSWAEQARSELRAAGERIQAQEPNAQDVLSAQELQIARLAAEGLSNRAIGERLYLSHRTVGTHLYRILPKLKNHPGAASGPTQAGLNPQNPTTRPAVTTVGGRVIDENFAQPSTGPACPVITPPTGHLRWLQRGGIRAVAVSAACGGRAGSGRHR